MPMPMEYWSASKDFDTLLTDVRDSCMLQTHHQAYQTLRAVLHVFRFHLTPADALHFANVLPPVVRAIYVEDWEPASAPPPPFPSETQLAAEVLAIRRDHNLSPPSAVSDVTACLKRAIDPQRLSLALADLPAGAKRFWALSPEA